MNTRRQVLAAKEPVLVVPRSDFTQALSTSRCLPGVLSSLPSGPRHFRVLLAKSHASETPDTQQVSRMG